jgi:hypothetical protein
MSHACVPLNIEYLIESTVPVTQRYTGRELWPKTKFCLKTLKQFIIHNYTKQQNYKKNPSPSSTTHISLPPQPPPLE